MYLLYLSEIPHLLKNCIYIIHNLVMFKNEYY